jgi:hypothetical protein
MTLLQYRTLAAYWRKFPPTHLLLAKLLGFKAEDRGSNDLSDLMSAFGQAGRIQNHASI